MEYDPDHPVERVSPTQPDGHCGYPGGCRHYLRAADAHQADPGQRRIKGFGAASPCHLVQSAAGAYSLELDAHECYQQRRTGAGDFVPAGTKEGT